MLFKSRWLSLRNLLLALLVAQLVVLFGRAVRVPTKLTMVIPANEATAWASVTQPGEDEYLNVPIELSTGERIIGNDPLSVQAVATDAEISTPGDRFAIYKTDLKNDTATYDIVLMDITWTAPFAEDLVDLGKLAKRDGVELSDFLPSELEAGTYEQTLYRMPMYADVGLLFYRQDLVEGKFLFSTPKNLAKTIASIKDSSSIEESYLWQGESYEGLVVNFLEVLSSFGGYWIDEDGNVGLGDSAAIQAAETMRELIRQDVSPPTVTSYAEQDSLEDFKMGQSAFLRGWPGFLQSLEADKIAIAPPFSFGPIPAMGCRGGWGLGIPKNSRHKEEAWEAIKYLTSESAQKRFVLTSNLLPTRRSLFTDAEIVAKFPQIGEIYGYLESSDTFRPTIPRYEVASVILQKALSKILADESISIEETMNAAQKETERKLSSSV